MTDYFQAHDLLKLTREGVDRWNGLTPQFSLSLTSFPFVVVRRAEVKGGLVPIGIRGRERHERYAGWIEQNHIAAHITPEAIDMRSCQSAFPAFIALQLVRQRMRTLQVIWGPTGSSAFELVSGATAVHAGSDLDIMVRAAKPLTDDTLRSIVATTHDLTCTVDIQIETPYGAFSPQEYLRSRGECMLRTVHGPRLVASPWLPQHQAKPA